MKRLESAEELGERLCPVPSDLDPDIAATLVAHACAQRALIVGTVQLRDAQVANALEQAAKEAWEGPDQEGRPEWLDGFVAMLRRAP